MLEKYFAGCCKTYTVDNNQVRLFWEEIETAYNNKKRYYHNLLHLENLIKQLLPVKQQIQNWDAIVFAVFYHDIIYNPVKKDNEEKSAALAAKRLSLLNCGQPTIESCRNIILATRKHEINIDGDVNYFTDADLSVLGADWDTYKKYADNVRKEYAVFPDIIYKPGRRKVLEHFSLMKRIFKTTYFFDRYELKAKNNLRKELELIS